MSHQIRGRHMLGGIALAALVSLPFDAMIVNAVITDIRMERAFRAADARAVKRAHDRAIADSLYVHAEPGRRGNQGVTLGRDRGFARSSSSSAHQGRVESVVVASAQGVRPERSVSVNVPEQNEAAGTGRSLLYEVTAYSHGCTLPRSGREPHAQRAANGRWPIADVTVAADTSLHPFGTEVLIEGLGFRTVHDRGRAIKGRRLDLFVDSCREARAFGRRFLRVYPVPPATTREARGFDVEPTR